MNSEIMEMRLHQLAEKALDSSTSSREVMLVIFEGHPELLDVDNIGEKISEALDQHLQLSNFIIKVKKELYGVREETPIQKPRDN